MSERWMMPSSTGVEGVEGVASLHAAKTEARAHTEKRVEAFIGS
jgi:hypothetical protein